jgi:hypothetical protein
MFIAFLARRSYDAATMIHTLHHMADAPRIAKLVILRPVPYSFSSMPINVTKSILRFWRFAKMESFARDQSGLRPISIFIRQREDGDSDRRYRCISLGFIKPLSAIL